MQAGITVESLSLSPAEQRAYPRWYTDLLLRKRHDTVAVGDLLRFVDNFGIADRDKQRISSFLDQPLVVIEPVQFYIFLRLCGHLLQGQQLRKELAYVSAPVPKPRPILSKRKTQDDNNPFAKAPKNDMDSFMSLMGGTESGSGSGSGPGSGTGSGSGSGSGSGKSHKKRVTFDAKPPEVAEAAQRSMQELLRQRALAPQPLVSPAPQPQPSTPQQKEPEPDVPLPKNQFANVNIDSVLHDGHGSIPDPPPPRKLTPNMTGPGQMVQMGAIKPGESLSNVLESGQPGQIQPQLTGQHTGLSGQLMGPSSQLSSQSTGNLPHPFLQNQSSGSHPSYIHPTNTGALSPQGTQGSPSVQPQATFPGYSSAGNGYQQFPQAQSHPQQQSSAYLQAPQVPFVRQNSGSPVTGNSTSLGFNPQHQPQQHLGAQNTGYAQSFPPQQLQPHATAPPASGFAQQYQRPPAQIPQAQQPPQFQAQNQNQNQSYQTYPQSHIQHQQQLHQNTPQYMGQQQPLGAQFQRLSISPMPTGQPQQMTSHHMPPQQMQHLAPQQYQQQQYQPQYYGGVQVPPPPPRRNF